MAEESEFELPVTVSKLSDDGIVLEFATAGRIALIAQSLQYCRRYWRLMKVFRTARHARYHPLAEPLHFFFWQRHQTVV
jgi:hypothetical protein